MTNEQKIREIYANWDDNGVSLNDAICECLACDSCDIEPDGGVYMYMGGNQCYVPSDRLSYLVDWLERNYS